MYLFRNCTKYSLRLQKSTPLKFVDTPSKIVDEPSEDVDVFSEIFVALGISESSEVFGVTYEIADGPLKLLVIPSKFLCR